MAERNGLVERLQEWDNRRSCMEGHMDAVSEASYRASVDGFIDHATFTAINDRLIEMQDVLNKVDVTK